MSAYYSTQARLEALASTARVKLFGDKNRDGTVDSTSLTQALAFAKNHIDALLCRRFQGTPFTWTSATVPPVLIPISDNLALYYLASGSIGVTEAIQRNYDQAIQFLQDIVDRKLDIPDANGDVLTEGSSYAAIAASSDLDDETYNRDFPLNDHRYKDETSDPEISFT